MTTISRPAPLTRRELTYYFFFSALVAMGAALLAGLIWMLMPPSEQALLGAVSDFPPSDQPYRVFVDRSPLYVVSAGGKLMALNPLIKKGPAKSCRVKWVPTNMRFEDPCWGAKFDLHGNYLDGPASRGLDQYPLRIKKQVWVDLSRTIPGAPRLTPTP